MARPVLGNLKTSLRLTPSVDRAVSLLAEHAGCSFGAVCVDAFRWLSARETGADHDSGPLTWPLPLVIEPSQSTIKACRSAVEWAGSEVRDVTRSFVMPPIAASLSELLPRVSEWPLYQTKIRWNASTSSYGVAQRRTTAPPSLVQWAAIVEYLSHLSRA